MEEQIVIRGAREHNLGNIDVTLPRNKLIVVTGLSGSGKSTLAFDTLYAEGQRRYVESLSAYARQFLGLMSKPDVDSIDGLSPAISIEQKTVSRNPRSTVGTITEIYDHLRLLFARIGIPHCPSCGEPIHPQTPEMIVDRLLQHPGKVLVMAPVVRGRKGTYEQLFEDLRQRGFVRVKVDGETYPLDDVPALERYVIHHIAVIVDRLTVPKKKAEQDAMRARLQEAVETALSLVKDAVIVEFDGEEHILSIRMACPKCDVSIGELQPRMFSFNNPYGACPECHGLGIRTELDPELVVPDPTLTLEEGAIKPWTTQYWRIQYLRGVARHFDIPMDTPFNELSEEHRHIILHGSHERIRFEMTSRRGDSEYKFAGKYTGIVPDLIRLHRETKSERRRRDIERFMTQLPCQNCKGKRLRPEVIAVTVGDLNIDEVTSLSIARCQQFFKELKLNKTHRLIAKQVLKEIDKRLDFLMNVGLEYLSLSRSAATLSAGETQRIRLATQIGANLVGVMYILDEPSIGLHQRDNRRLIDTLLKLRDLGNTLIVVEHDEETIRTADHIVDIGPGAGIHGGHIVAQGTVTDIKGCEDSITGKYLSGKKTIPIPEQRREPSGGLTVVGARENNLKHIDVRIPLGVLCLVTGVSGSGKSTLVNLTLKRALKQRFYRSSDRAGAHDRIDGIDQLDKVIAIDQSPIGRTPRSNPATYTGLFTPIRELFATTSEAKVRGYKPGRFSFNVKAGQCHACVGAGLICIEMNFLPDIYIPCEECKGTRYNRETLQVTYKEKSIADVLDMTVEEALRFFENIPKIRRRLQTIMDVGLGYIKLGQSATTLSGGEAQRVKLSSELSKRGTGRTLYILDEPTTGLHFDDVKKLLKVLDRLVEKGNSIVVIEHNLDVIKCADRIIDLGPEGGEAGGTVIAEGTPEQVARSRKSYTGKFLRGMLG
ncbi:MAG: excinuclease ABC subunit UvrA [Candidatus Undinarchaeales archaeon]|nr:excinuclease ABC subunit UvrA [Candidatus Undinarchaeales archaeon]MDP7494007.1 excinuclease ABC subunit UvrA [Candidatus Undinarchaeales archaeon]